MALFEPLFKALNDAGVRYVVVGGLAVVLHGHARMTVDVDLFVDHPIRFDDLWSRSTQMQLQNTSVQVASFPDLIRMKRLAGRPQDQIDIEQLTAIQKAQRKSGDD